MSFRSKLQGSKQRTGCPCRCWTLAGNARKRCWAVLNQNITCLHIFWASCFIIHNSTLAMLCCYVYQCQLSYRNCEVVWIKHVKKGAIYIYIENACFLKMWNMWFKHVKQRANNVFLNASEGLFFSIFFWFTCVLLIAFGFFVFREKHFGKRSLGSGSYAYPTTKIGSSENVVRNNLFSHSRRFLNLYHNISASTLSTPIR